MVISTLDLFDSFTDRLGGSEIHRCTLYSPNFAGRDEAFVDRSVIISGEHKLMAEDVAGTVACEVEVAVMCKI